MLNYMKALLKVIKEITKPSYLFCRLKIQEARWYVQYYMARIEKLYPQKLTKLELNLNEKIVVLVPHADDEWIGPYSVIRQRPSKLSIVYFNLFGNNYSDNNVRIRNSEIIASSKYWGFKLIDNHNYDVESLCEVLKDVRYCFLPSPYDWHEEHRNVFKTFVEAHDRLSCEQKNSIEIYYYCVSVPHPKSLSLFYIPLTKRDVDEKWRQFSKIYSSQAFMPAVRYKLQMRLVPSEVGYAAQTFVKANADMLSRDYDLVTTSNEIQEFANLKNHINNIVGNRRMIEHLKNEIKNESHR